jgi:hypothetical protein
MDECCFGTRPDGVLSVCAEEESSQFVASFIPRLPGGVLNASGIIHIGEFQSAREARQALVAQYGQPDAWLSGHPEALHMRSQGPDLL